MQLSAASGLGLAWNGLGSSAAIAVARTNLPAKLPFMDRIGLQLYTVRNQMAEDKRRTLELIAQAGYKQVELMSIDKGAFEIAAIARDLGMMVHSAFMDWKSIVMPSDTGVPSVDQIVEMAERLGLRHIVFGYIGQGQRETEEQCKRIADNANQAAAKARAAGIRMCYHNHSFEFAKLKGSQRTGFDLFMERFDSQVMEYELDVFWTKLGGLDPFDLMRKLGGKISQVHLKDIKAGAAVITNEGQVPVDTFKELGAGTIDMVKVVQLAQEIGVAACHVEQDQSPAPLESIVKSIEHLKRT
jgi:sugar phosphate isomerase/epimerase